MFSKILSNLQKVGQAFMLPVAVLPAAGILMGIGSANLPFIPKIISHIMESSGSAIFSLLPVMFAIAIAIAFTKNSGSAGLASIVGYFVFNATMGVIATKTTEILGIKTIDTGVLGGIIVGTITAITHNKFNGTKLPEFLAFFSGNRLIPILTSFFCLLVGIVFVFIWSPIGAAIDAFSNWAAVKEPIIAYPIYSFLERILLPTGLHHILNVPFFFQTGTYIDPNTHQVIHGEVNRFLAGDKTAGMLAGSYLYQMWGLPGAAMAMWYCAKPEKRKLVGGIMISAALTAFLTGITEPVEFSFLFVAPLLYVFYACLCPIAYVVVISLGIHHSTTFSQGLIDYIVLYPHAQKPLLIIPLGILWFIIYFCLFTFCIKFWNLKTPGREDDEEDIKIDTASNNLEIDIGEQIVKAYGGIANITNVDACITRLRINVKDSQKVDEETLKKLGAKGVVKIGDHAVQSIFGTKAEQHRQSIDKYINNNKK